MTDGLWLFRLGHTWVCFSGSVSFSGSHHYSTQSIGREGISHKSLSKYFTVFCYIFISKPIPVSGGWNGIGLGHTRPSPESPSQLQQEDLRGWGLCFPRARYLSKATWHFTSLSGCFQVQVQNSGQRAWILEGQGLSLSPVSAISSCVNVDKLLNHPLFSSVKWNRY